MRYQSRRRRDRLWFSICFLLLIFFSIIMVYIFTSITSDESDGLMPYDKPNKPSRIDFLNALSDLSNKPTNFDEETIAVNFEEREIRKLVKNLPRNYSPPPPNLDIPYRVFGSNLIFMTEERYKIDYDSIWGLAQEDIRGSKLFSYQSRVLGRVVKGLRAGRIKQVDLDKRGTQLKLLLTLEGNQRAIFKPQWYDVDDTISGSVYSGKDRYQGEIIAFYLSALLNFTNTPIATERAISFPRHILPLATAELNSTIFHDQTWCVYGKCFYCKKDDALCGDARNYLTGAVILDFERPLKKFRSPWQRTYKEEKLAKWQVDKNYCSIVRKKHGDARILDFVDMAVFDFLIQNGDRHHYETLDNEIVLLDNGKSFGDASKHYLDILAPLYQCCSIRKSTIERLLQLCCGRMKDYLNNFMSAQSQNHLLTEKHALAMEHRLKLIYAGIEYCISRMTNR